METGSGKGLDFGATAGSLPDTVSEPDWYIGRTLSARALNYEVLDKNGSSYRFIEGTKIEDTEVFAGKGVRKKLRPEVSRGLSEQHGGRPKDWKHVKGIGSLDFHGRPRKAEVHWFEESHAGKVKFKVKKWLD